MRIAMISEHASPLAATGGVDAGGQNIYVAQVARCLVRQGHEVDVFTRRDDSDLPTVVDVAPKLRVVHVHAGPASFVPKEQLLGHMGQFALFCEAWMRTVPAYDLIHANFFMSGWVGLRLKETFGLPLVTTFHALGRVRQEHQKEADAFPLERIDIERAVSAGSDRIVAECPQDRLDLMRLYQADPSRLAMVPCGFDAEEFTPLPRAEARRRLGIPGDEFMVLQVGRMVPRKGVETVVRAMACPPCADMRLHVVGGECEVPDPWRTPEIGRLQQVARDCGVANRVQFAGCKPREELRHWYAAADVFVTVPWYEPFGITPLEAMACARPVVGSAVGGVQYTVEHGRTGLLVPPKDPAALAAALAELRDDPARAEAMGVAGRKRACSAFTWEGVALRLASVFEEARAEVQAHGSVFHVMGLDEPLSATTRTPQPRPAIFIDKDGTLVEDVPYNVDPARLRFTPHAVQALRLWREAGYRIVVITNQCGIGRGLFKRDDLSRLHDAMAERLAREGVPIDAFFACPHPDTLGCRCRKPREGLLLEAARALDIDLERSWMVGDILNDVEAGHRAGCRSVLLDVGHETEWLHNTWRTPEHRCTDLLDAAQATLLDATVPSHAAPMARERVLRGAVA
jgi:D-inositol-3-phosphate glycosyltransferase